MVKLKKVVMMIGLFMVTLLFCSGCDGDVTRALRHDGFNIGNNEFVCSAFADEDNREKIKFMTGTNIITESGKIYDLSLSQKYSNDEHCKLADTNLKVVAIFDGKVFKADDNKMYYLATGDGNSYTEVTQADNSYYLYELLLKPEGTIKVLTADSSSGIYYVLKSDGNVYAYTIESSNRGNPPSIVGTTAVYESGYYGGDIIDFNYAGNSGATFVRSASNVYRMKATNSAECSKYADVNCDYAMSESEVFSEYGDYILAYNGSTLITTYNKIFTAS